MKSFNKQNNVLIAVMTFALIVQQSEHYSLCSLLIDQYDQEMVHIFLSLNCSLDVVHTILRRLSPTFLLYPLVLFLYLSIDHMNINITFPPN